MNNLLSNFFFTIAYAEDKTVTSISALDEIVPASSFKGQPLSNLLNQLFYIGLIAAVILAVIMIIIAGIQYMTTDAISGKDTAKRRIQASMGGLLLAFSGVLILNTINPGITEFSIVLETIKVIEQKIEQDNLVSVGRETPIIPVGQQGVGTNATVKGDFSAVTAADLRPHLGPDYSDSDVQAFVDAGREHGIDPRFLASVSKFETANGTSKAFTDGRNNAMGVSNSTGPIGFSSVRESIFYQARNLVKEGGYYTQATTIKQIGDIYSPAINPATGKPYPNDIHGTNHSWAGSVGSNYTRMTNGGDGN